MSNFSVVFTRAFILCQPRFIKSDERGQATAEYGVVLLVAIALGMAVLMLFTGGTFDSVLSAMLNKVLQAASGMIHA